jgi:hypothetical protein
MQNFLKKFWTDSHLFAPKVDIALNDPKCYTMHLPARPAGAKIIQTALATACVNHQGA